MTELTFLNAAVAVIGGLVTSISIWAPRRLWLTSAQAKPLLPLPLSERSTNPSQTREAPFGTKGGTKGATLPGGRSCPPSCMAFGGRALGCRGARAPDTFARVSPRRVIPPSRREHG